MKLPHPKIDMASSLQEFDVWVTPSLGEIRDTEKYQQALAHLVNGFEVLMQATQGFADDEACHPDRFVPALQQIIGELSPAESAELLKTITSVLYLVTGKTDNNVKCQFPLFLRDQARLTTLPIARKRGLSTIALPRVLKAERLMRIVAGLKDYPQQQALLLQRFVEFILSDETYISQFWSIGHSFVALNSIGKGADLLSPLAVFQVRGSVSARGGHDPEDILRQRLTEWGLQAGTDFNEADVTLDQLVSASPAQDPSTRKTRAYDFVLPYRSWQKGRRLLIQCQFYAGDSGSVSHKNVDQTRSTRDATAKILPEAIFIEYVDGAGYFASLHGDLRSLLAMPDTSSFFQIRTAPIRLRRELQAIGFLTPLEIEHAILRVGQDQRNVFELLVQEGYPENEISRRLSQAIERGLILHSDVGVIGIHPDRRTVCRRYALLDVAAMHGQSLATGDISGKLLIPGYGPFYGLRQNDLIRLAIEAMPVLGQDWQQVEAAFDDLQWLIDQRFITSGL